MIIPYQPDGRAWVILSFDATKIVSLNSETILYRPYQSNLRLRKG
jgi:hypothetical protein